MELISPNFLLVIFLQVFTDPKFPVKNPAPGLNDCVADLR